MTDMVEMLRAENDRLQRTKKALRQSRDCWLMKVVEQSAEIERLRAALREIESITVHSGGDIHGVHPSFWEVAFKQAQDTARAALGGGGE